MSTSRFRSASGWNDVAARGRVKDYGQRKNLGADKRVGDDRHDQALKVREDEIKLAEQIKKDKKTAPAAGKYVDDGAAAARLEVHDVAKPKADKMRIPRHPRKATTNKRRRPDRLADLQATVG
jgi:hypothetical protein